MFGRYSIQQFSFMADAINKDTGKEVTFTVNGDLTSFTVRVQNQEETEKVEADQVVPAVAIAQPFTPTEVADAAPPSPTAESLSSQSEYSEELSADDGTDANYGMEQQVDFLTEGLNDSVNILDTTDSSSDYDEVGGFSQEQYFTPLKKVATKKAPKKPAARNQAPVTRKQPGRRGKK
ncbi:hypothetical protein SEMRO_198_G083950.1 [Seminavis robusta]|uniref:Uncharacterized protein n=1 Tax=Seminavis robusta TaxID=568900 RepID=A0A9N8DKQ2_9STRA|nr:hypothetical protein SEMRO_198_G083950.1 [Seminavis robusta]|eukprot:Sro198_g083950.1 n/a (178) ;mRNA; f:182-715